MNLASLRYGRVLLKHHGPIERIEYGRVRVGHREIFQANAYLSGHLNLERPETRIFSNADGSGSHRAAIIARHKAISEAIERWALYSMNQSDDHGDGGMDLDSTSTGMAAYPGLFSRQARKRAVTEAVERFCIVAWWEGFLQSRNLQADRGDFEALEIENPLSTHRVAIVWRRTQAGFLAYGFSAGTSLESAIRNAEVEMERSVVAVSRYFRKNPGFELDDLETIGNFMERRILYYSLPEGHREFMARVETPARGSPLGKRKPVVDLELRGPWSQYATVWRVLFPMPTRSYLSPFRNFFYW